LKDIFLTFFLRFICFSLQRGVEGRDAAGADSASLTEASRADDSGIFRF